MNALVSLQLTLVYYYFFYYFTTTTTITITATYPDEYITYYTHHVVYECAYEPSGYSGE
jgi:hypothetical protein